MPQPIPYRRPLDDLVAELFPGGRVVRARRLRGGLGSLMHAVDVEHGGERVRLTLRRFNQPQWGMDRELARRESEVLHRLHAAGLPVPCPIWTDPEGDRFTVPALLLRRLPGRAILAPDDIVVWCGGLAESLLRIHSVDPTTVADILPDETREERNLRYLNEEATPDELASQLVDSERLLEVVRDRIGVSERPRVTHGDFHAGNVLWSRGRVSGVVDWPGVRLGDPRFDVAYLRLDTALVLGQEAGATVLGAYEEASGDTLADGAAWELFAATTALPDPTRWVPGYVEQGREDLDEATVRERYAAFVERALAAI